MSTKVIVQPYLFFNGRCEEALEFYRNGLDAEITMLMRFKDAPDPKAAGGDPDKVMHASFSIGNTQLMASDGDSSEGPSFQGFALTLSVESEADANRVFSALKKGGKVVTPLAKTFFSPCFGMVTDPFGMLWMVLTAAEQTEKKQ